jgi:hypothetical protein
MAIRWEKSFSLAFLAHLLASDGCVDSDLLVTSDTEGSNGISGFALRTVNSRPAQLGGIEHT